MAENQTKIEEQIAIEKAAIQAKAEKKLAEDKAKANEKIKCKVHSLSLVDKKSTIFVSINNYMADIPQNIELELPRYVVQFLKTATKVSHVVKGKKTVAVNEPLYSVDISI